MKNTRHHLYPRHLWGCNTWNNLIFLKENVHQALHLILDKDHKAQAPREQIITLFNILSPALTSEFKSDVYKILLETDNKYYYKDWIYLPK